MLEVMFPRSGSGGLVAIVMGLASAAVAADDRSIKPPGHDTKPMKAQPRVPLPTDGEAWRYLPAIEKGTIPPSLPSWAKALARSLPRTTAAMLELDRLHRARSPLGLRLSGQLRWVAADANRCDYSRAMAEADLRRAGLDEIEMGALDGDPAGFSGAHQAALSFARKMTLSADSVTDQEVSRLMSEFGPAQVTAMVLLLAHASFQDRLLLALDLTVEPGGPLPPVEVRFAKGSSPPPVPSRKRPERRPAPRVPERVSDPEWQALDWGALQKSLSGQRGYPGRIRVPGWDEVLKVLPPGYPIPKNPVRIRWSLVCLGYQPELAAAWSACTRAFGEEAKQDRVFEESLFWVVTRTIHCFY
jgi:alkylhydroperoxidase family enzyme